MTFSVNGELNNSNSTIRSSELSGKFLFDFMSSSTISTSQASNKMCIEEGCKESNQIRHICVQSRERLIHFIINKIYEELQFNIKPLI